MRTVCAHLAHSNHGVITFIDLAYTHSAIHVHVGLHQFGTGNAHTQTRVPIDYMHCYLRMKLEMMHVSVIVSQVVPPIIIVINCVGRAVILIVVVLIHSGCSYCLINDVVQLLKLLQRNVQVTPVALAIQPGHGLIGEELPEEEDYSIVLCSDDVMSSPLGDEHVELAAVIYRCLHYKRIRNVSPYTETTRPVRTHHALYLHVLCRLCHRRLSRIQCSDRQM